MTLTPFASTCLKPVRLVTVLAGAVILLAACSTIPSDSSASATSTPSSSQAGDTGGG